jgi:hypothetical protein
VECRVDIRTYGETSACLPVLFFPRSRTVRAPLKSGRFVRSGRIAPIKVQAARVGLDETKQQ